MTVNSIRAESCNLNMQRRQPNGLQEGLTNQLNVVFVLRSRSKRKYYPGRTVSRAKPVPAVKQWGRCRIASSLCTEFMSVWRLDFDPEVGSVLVRPGLNVMFTIGGLVCCREADDVLVSCTFVTNLLHNGTRDIDNATPEPCSLIETRGRGCSV
jgi:hypothetical protein